MPSLRFRLLVCLTLLGFAAHAGAAEARSLFNGRDLAGWSGNPAFWSVRDGTITGRTTAEQPLKANTFIVWQGGEVADFELHLKFRLIADNARNFANSGVQYRSRVIDPGAWIVGGYQADMDAANQYTGMLYEERGRGILVRPGERIRIGPAGADGKPALEPTGPAGDPAAIKAAIKAGEWNELVIIARGNQVRHLVNGQVTAEFTDTDDAVRARSGVLALQLHTGEPMTVQFKDISLQPLAP